MIKLACSYNNGFIDDIIPIYQGVQLIEMGTDAYYSLFNNKTRKQLINYNNKISIHFSRSPITEDDFIQDLFIDEKLIDLSNDESVISLGFHLCGNRDENIGCFGFSSHYYASANKENQAIRFINNVQKQTKKEVWIENANFYSSSVKEIYQNWKSVCKIVSDTQCSLILDLSHLIIDCCNNNLNPYFILGMIDWGLVAEIHLSGIVEGRDHTLHDGHGLEIPDNVWNMLQEIINTIDLKNVYINIEHSERAWADKLDAYRSDFIKLEALLANNLPERSGIAEKSENYAKSYLKKNIKDNVKNLTYILKELEINETELFERWFDYILRENKRISLSRTDMESFMLKKSIYYIDSFSKFIKEFQNESRC